MSPRNNGPSSSTAPGIAIGFSLAFLFVVLVHSWLWATLIGENKDADKNLALTEARCRQLRIDMTDTVFQRRLASHLKGERDLVSMDDKLLSEAMKLTKEQLKAASLA